MKKFIFVLVLLVSTSRLSAQGVSTVANVGGIMAPTNMPGLRIWNNTCVWAIQMGPAGTSTIAGNYVLTAR
jgi:hypothetical protein